MRVAGIRDACVLSETEAFRQGLRGMAWDAHLIVRPWDFRLEQIRLPVHVWHGTADNSTPFAMAQYLVRSIPHATLHVLENEAHLLFFPHWEEILSTLIAE
jgi:pimeloyl-ACP methyl ester carboxylesterase